MIYIICIPIILILLVAILVYISNNWLKIKKYKITDKKLPNNFNNFKIAHISDVHSKIFGKDNKAVINKIKKIKPDIVIMSGDIIDKREENIEGFINNYKEIYNNYPTYYSIGNHERSLGYIKYKKYIELLKDLGVKVIINGSEKISIGNEHIVISALKFRYNMQTKELTEEKFVKYMKKKLNTIDKSEYNILISHDPENFKMYKKLNVDLIFSGHIHGGLIRIGNIGLLSPRRKFFPKYSYGKNVEQGTTIITSSGMGDATIPIRLFNRPEIVQVTFKKL